MATPQRGEARKAFFRIVDQSPGHELAPVAYLRIGRMFLEEGNSSKAISLLRRAEAFAAGSDIHPLAVLTLAAAHLASDNPLPANALLEKHRLTVRKDPFRQTAGRVLDVLQGHEGGHEIGVAVRERQRGGIGDLNVD